MTTTSQRSTNGLRVARLVLVATAALAVLASGTAARSAPGVHRITLHMREFAFQPTILRFHVGERVELIIRNDGVAEHEWSAGRDVVDTPYEKGFRTDLLSLLKPRIHGRGYRVERLMASNLNTNDRTEGETVARLSEEVDVNAGGESVLAFTVPRDARGEWQMGCFLPGQYESGMFGTIRIR